MAADNIPGAPDVESAVATLRWVIAACFAAIATLSTAIAWLFVRFSGREETTMANMRSAVMDMADAVGNNTDTISTVGGRIDKHLERANQLERDRQMAANIRRDHI